MDRDWSNHDPPILAYPLWQEVDICWAISFIRHMESRLKLAGRLGMNSFLSIQELVDVMPPRFRSRRGSIYDARNAIPYLTSYGTVLEDDCPLTYSLRSYGHTPHVRRYSVRSMDLVSLHDVLVEYTEEFGFDVFENMLLEELDKGPVAARIVMCEGYEDAVGNGGIYQPSLEERETSWIGHYLLLTAAEEVGGIMCWAGQDSLGSWRNYVLGRSGFVGGRKLGLQWDRLRSSQVRNCNRVCPDGGVRLF